MIGTWRLSNAIWDFSVVSEKSNRFYLIELMVTLSFLGDCTGITREIERAAQKWRGERTNWGVIRSRF